MTEYSTFQHRAREKATDDKHRLKILKAITTYNGAVERMKTLQWLDWQQARSRAAAVKDAVLAELPELLVQFESRLQARGGQVLWAETAAEARAHILQIIGDRGARKVVKSKSMTTEEIGLNECLQEAGVEVWESDLGELIVQLAGEKPYHIVTPAMHKSKAEIARLFQEKLHAPPTDDAEVLTAVARNHLRDAYITAEIGITGANFLLAEEGAVVLTENEGNARLTTSCPPVHIAIAGIEKVLPRLADLALFFPLLSTSGTGQELTCYNSIIRGPRAPGEPDGPEEMYVILLDNGRSALYQKQSFRHALRCIRCGACLNACPVYRTIGGHAYNTTYQGPIGSVITPHLRDLAQWGHLAAASSLCGACSEVCPVEIDIHHLLLENRWEARRSKKSAGLWGFVFRRWASIMSSRARLQRFRPLARLAARAGKFMPASKCRRVPDLAPKSFAELWEEKIGQS